MALLCLSIPKPDSARETTGLFNETLNGSMKEALAYLADCFACDLDFMISCITCGKPLKREERSARVAPETLSSCHPVTMSGTALHLLISGPFEVKCTV